MLLFCFVFKENLKYHASNSARGSFRRLEGIRALPPFDLLVTLGLGRHLLPLQGLRSAGCPGSLGNFSLTGAFWVSLSAAQMSPLWALGEKSGIPELARGGSSLVAGGMHWIRILAERPPGPCTPAGQQAQRGEATGSRGAAFSQILCFGHANGRQNVY